MNWFIVGIVCLQAFAWISVCSFLLIKGVSNLTAEPSNSPNSDPRAHKTGIILLCTSAIVFVLPPLLILAVKKCKRLTNPEFRAVPQDDLPPSYEEATKTCSTKRY